MSLSLLLDLDDTLLENDINKFLPHYLKALGKQLAPFVPPDKMAAELLSATETMTRNEHPGRTLEETFDQQFYPRIGTTKQDLAAVLTDFYELRFPELRFLTRPGEHAANLIDQAQDLGYSIAIATNPVFPLRAIQHRLDWAGLPVEKYPFALVTAFERFHFAKPNPAYYAECLAQMGWPDQPAVMVGNSPSQDLQPAGILGLPGFWVTSGTDPLPASLPALSRKGGLDQVIPWLQEVRSARASLPLENRETILAVLKSTPAALDTFSRGLSSERWSYQPQESEWCFTEIICHLRDSDLEIHLPRVERILGENNTFVSAVNADEWSETRAYCSEDGPRALQGFISSRIELIQKLESLSPEEWESPARHAIFGPTTLKELMSFIAQHDRTHIQQALQTLKHSAALS